MNQRQTINQLPKNRFAPKYVELAQKLLRRMADRGMGPGDRLGTELELVKKYGVSRVTVRQALAMLEGDGYISREKARGTFVKRAVSQTHHLGLVRGTVVLVCSNEQAEHVDEDYAFATVLRAMERSLARQGFTVQILGIGEDRQADRTRLQQMGRMDDLEGVCTIGPCLEAYRDLVPEVPIVNSCTFYSGAWPWVGEDVETVCYESVKYLLNRGHHDIAMVCGSWVNHRAFGVFARGYERAFAEAGVPCKRCLMYHAYPGESLPKLATEVLTGPIRPTAVFAENWRVCEAVLDAARAMNVNIPDDLSVVAYGQNVLQLNGPVAITAYVPDSERIGLLAAEMLVDILDGTAEELDHHTVPGRMIERSSVSDLAAVHKSEPSEAEGAI